MHTLRSPALEPGATNVPLRRRSACGLLAAVAGAGWLTGCAGPAPKPPPKPGTLSINIVASSSINPDARNRPSPLVVRMYELKASAQFDSADFLSLYDKDQSVLGADIVVRDEVVVRPGEAKAINKPLAADTRFIGVVAAFRELERATWRAVVSVLPNKDNVVTISLDGIAVRTTVVAT